MTAEEVNEEGRRVHHRVDEHCGHREALRGDPCPEAAEAAPYKPREVIADAVEQIRHETVCPYRIIRDVRGEEAAVRVRLPEELPEILRLLRFSCGHEAVEIDKGAHQ